MKHIVGRVGEETEMCEVEVVNAVGIEECSKDDVVVNNDFLWVVGRAVAPFREQEAVVCNGSQACCCAFGIGASSDDESLAFIVIYRNGVGRCGRMSEGRKAALRRVFSALLVSWPNCRSLFGRR